MKHLFICVIAFMLLLTVGCASAQPTQTSEGAGFDSPEAAAKAYLEGLRDADLDRMLSTFAIESYVKNYDFEASLNRIKAYTPSQEIKFPNTNELVTSINIENYKAQVVRGILFQYFTLCNPEYDQSEIQTMKDEATVNEFTTQLNNNINTTKLDTLKILGSIPPEALWDLYLSEQNQDNIERQAEICGANKRTSCVVAFELDGYSGLILCLDAVEYNEKWFIASLSGNVGAALSIPVFHGGLLFFPTDTGSDIDEFRNLITPIE